MRKKYLVRRAKRLTALCLLIPVALSYIACSNAPQEDDSEALAAQEWAWLQEKKEELDRSRGELQNLQDRIAGKVDAVETATEQETPAATEEELTAQQETLKAQIISLTEEFGSRLIKFINDQQIGVNSELTDIQRQAMSMKSAEDIVLAQEYIDLGGEYGRAIDIYNQALAWDPENEMLLAAKTNAEEMRYINEERFATVKKKMSQDEVRELLGTPKRANIREFEDGKIVGWFYPKDPQIAPSAAAGVYFQKKNEKLNVYRTDYNAIKGN